MEKESRKAAGYSRYLNIGLVRHAIYLARKEVAGIARSIHNAVGFHQSIIVRDWSPMENPNATIISRINAIPRIISAVLFFKFR